MSGIQSSVGLISGIDYVSLVDKLIEVDSVTKTNLEKRNELLIEERNALEDLMALFLNSSYMIKALNSADRFNSCTLTSSSDALTATKNGTPAVGSYTFTPLQAATTQQTVAQGVASDTEALGKTGTITIGKSWTLENNVELQHINGGNGFTKGYIRITDGSGTRSTIDLRSAVSMNDVIETINNDHNIDVSAEIIDDRIVLTDLSGGDPSKLSVQEVSGGSTAASLGLAGVTADENGIVGNSIYRLGENMSLSQLNDGNGLIFDSVLPEITVYCKDGSMVSIDFNRLSTTEEIEAGASEIHREITVGDLLETINKSTDAGGVAGKVQASISDDGRRIVFRDTTEGSNTTQFVQPSGAISPVFRTLGLINGDYESALTSEDGTLTTRQLIGGLSSPLMSTLNGGYGLSNAAAGTIEVQDRAGNQAVLSFTQEELDSMQTFEDAVSLLNDKLKTAKVEVAEGEEPKYGIGISVRMNDSKTGFQLVDTTGKNTANMIFRDKTVTTTTTVPAEEEGGEPATVTTTTSSNIASSLGLNINSAQSKANGDSMNKQVVSYSTKLSDLNGGRGITLAGGKITITDSAGRSEILTIDASTHQTLGDVINSINRTNISVNARINDAGDGILLEEFAGGSGTFSCLDDSVSKFAADLGINKSANQSQKTENGHLLIEGSTTYKIEVVETDTLDDIRKKINDAGGNFSASIIYDGTSTPYRLTISGKSTGTAAGMNIDLSCLGLTAENMSEAADAILVYGDAGNSAGIVFHSGSNTFKNIISGVDITVKGASDTPITITSEKSSMDIKVALKAFVENYNTFREKLNADTYYDTEAYQGKILYNNHVARAFDRNITNVLLKRVYGITGINSLQSLGITIRPALTEEAATLNEESIDVSAGTLTFDEEVFDALYASNPDGIRDFFFKEQEILGDDGKPTTIKSGWAQTFSDAADLLTDYDGIAYHERDTLDTKISKNAERIAYLNERLVVKQQMYLNKFYAMEQALAQMSSDMNTVSSIADSWASNSSSS
ncbi:MAG: flagellar filament capping protein FliD [Planctomycetaceae bacterium]|jgi:flagellar hook-associated protein 2|nr:flagellar filament capping protein FliD [Planctomycetaceae bacterium]